jgi:hypothetical protein
MVRITAVLAWSWQENACTVQLDSDPASWTAVLPPLASPRVAYAPRLDGPRRTVEDWVAGAPTWEVDDGLLDDVPEESLAAARAALGQPAGCKRELILAAARRRDVQVVPAMGRWMGFLDGEALCARDRERLFENFAAFGRHEKRNTKRPHAAALPTADDPPSAQLDDFSRSTDPVARRKAIAATAWRAVRRARLAGGSFSRDAVARDFGNEGATVLEEETDAFEPLPPRAPPAEMEAIASSLSIRSVGKSENLLFCNAPDRGADAVHWFASCMAAALSHPSAASFLKTLAERTAVGAYAVHERAGAVYVLSTAAGRALCAGGAEISCGGLVYVAHPTVLEGACSLFEARSVRRLGVYCPRLDGATWTPALLRRVLALLAPGGEVHTNCVSTGFLLQ